jgi:hypothetical protein
MDLFLAQGSISLPQGCELPTNDFTIGDGIISLEGDAWPRNDGVARIQQAACSANRESQSAD